MAPKAIADAPSPAAGGGQRRDPRPAGDGHQLHPAGAVAVNAGRVAAHLDSAFVDSAFLDTA